MIRAEPTIAYYLLSAMTVLLVVAESDHFFYALQQAVLPDPVGREPLTTNFSESSPLEPFFDSAQVSSTPHGRDISLCQILVDATNRLFVSGFENELLCQPLLSREENNNTLNQKHRDKLAEQLI